jgi:peptidoglycan/LPS O-acetylase OafA/YrhL
LEWIYYLTLTICIPLLFIFTGKSKADRFFGDLSYPVYIIHVLVISILVAIGLSRTNNINKVLIIIGVLFTAYLLNKYIATPIEKYRQKRITKKLAYEKLE